MFDQMTKSREEQMLPLAPPSGRPWTLNKERSLSWIAWRGWLSDNGGALRSTKRSPRIVYEVQSLDRRRSKTRIYVVPMYVHTMYVGVCSWYYLYCFIIFLLHAQLPPLVSLKWDWYDTGCLRLKWYRVSETDMIKGVWDWYDKGCLRLKWYRVSETDMIKGVWDWYGTGCLRLIRYRVSETDMVQSVWGLIWYRVSETDMVQDVWDWCDKGCLRLIW